MERPSWFEPVRGFGEWFGFLGGIAVIVGVLALIAWSGLRLADGRVSFSGLSCLDPTDLCNYSTYRVHNNTHVNVTVRGCFHWCGPTDNWSDAYRIAPGAASSATAVTAPVDGRAWWLVVAPGGRRLGCLVLDGHRSSQNGAVVLVSEARPCRPNQPLTRATGRG